MAEIGAQLREARTRARIEIAQMEAQTKIRAKYLRALENEEWDLLPGPTYVKSFLRTYGDMLGLDGRQLVADYKSAQEPFHAEGDIGQLSKHTGGRINRQQQAGAQMARLIVAAVIVLGLIAGGGYALLFGGDDAPPVVAGTTPQDDLGADLATTAQDGSELRRVEVVVSATADTTVCVRSGRRIAVREQKLEAGEKTRTVTGRVVLVTAFNRSVRVRVDDRQRTLPAAPAGPATFVVSENGVRRASDELSACRV